MAGAMTAALLAGCGSSASTASSTSSESSGEAGTSAVPTIDSINLGTDYQDVKADIKILTNRTDIVDTKYAEYAEQFHELYPNITVTYEAVTDYEEALTCA